MFLSSTVAISPHIKHNLLCDIQQIISACWRPWLTNNRFVAQAAAGDEVSYKDTSDYADQACDSIFQNSRWPATGAMLRIIYQRALSISFRLAVTPKSATEARQSAR